MVGAVLALEDPQRPFEQVADLLRLPQIVPRGAEVVQGAGDLDVVGAVRALEDPQRPFVQLAGLLRLPHVAGEAGTATAARPSSASAFDRLFSALARSGRNAAGRAAASSRRMSTASPIAASASSHRPSSASALDRLFSDPARAGRNASGRAAASSR
ncbi:MAG TPA: hypothetical protein VF317_07125 [Dermatophilaceae bacterium]